MRSPRRPSSGRSRSIPTCRLPTTSIPPWNSRPAARVRRCCGSSSEPACAPRTRELFAGLVQACRYAGLQRPAIVAHEHAVRLEPRIRTAVCHAYLTAGEYEKAVAHDHDDPPIVTTLALDLMGQRDRAIAHARQQIVPGMPPLFRLFFELTIARSGGSADGCACRGR